MSLGAGEEEESTWEGWEEATLSLVVRAVGPGMLSEAGPVVFLFDEDITGVDAPARPLGAPAAVAKPAAEGCGGTIWEGDATGTRPVAVLEGGGLPIAVGFLRV